MSKRETISAFQAQYICTFRPEPEGGYTVRCPAAFPEIVTYGSSLEEARGNAREAIELCLEVYRDEGRPLPPSDSETEETDPEDCAAIAEGRRDAAQGNFVSLNEWRKAAGFVDR